MTYDQFEIRTAKEEGRPLIAVAAVNIAAARTDGQSASSAASRLSRGAAGVSANVTSLNDAQAQLVTALAGFDRLGLRFNPGADLGNERKPWSKSERNDAAVAAVVVLEAAEAVERIARERLETTTSGKGGLVGLVIRATKIQSLMLEVVRTLMRATTPADSPVVIAALVFKAKSLAGTLTASHRALPLDSGSDTQAIPAIPDGAAHSAISGVFGASCSVTSRSAS